MNAENFELFERLEGVYLEPTINLRYLDDLLVLNINQENVYEILLIADFYQYKKMKELIEHIQILILDGKIKIDYDKLKKEDLYNSIYINDCVKDGEIKCNLQNKIHDICCVRYLIEYQSYEGYKDTISYAAYNGQIETIKYLVDLGYNGDKNAITYAAQNGHMEIIKYLESLGYKGDEWTINNAASNGHLEIIKYLVGLGYKGNENAINWAAENGHLETIKYLVGLGYKGTEYAIYWAAEDGHLETIKYLIEQKYNFTKDAIKDARTQEINDLLEANKHLMI